VPCKTVWLNGLLLGDSLAILKHLSWHLSTDMKSINFTAYEQLGAYIEVKHESEPIIFVLEDIDRFAMIPGQNLLYTLFEAQSNLHLPVLIIGVTEKYDVVSMLEKRVKSRFSQYVIAVGGKTGMDAVEAYMKEVEAALTLDGAPKWYRDWKEKLLKDKQVIQAFGKCFMRTGSLHYSLCRLVPLVSEMRKAKKFDLTPEAVINALEAGHTSSLRDTLAHPSISTPQASACLFTNDPPTP